MYKRLLIPTDGSKLATKAVIEGIRLAESLKAETVAVMITSTDPGTVVAGPMVVIAPSDALAEATDYARRNLEAVAAAAQKHGVACRTVHVAHEVPYRAILDTAAAEACDLIVMASHGHGGLKAFVLGSVTINVLSHSTIPVLVCR